MRASLVSREVQKIIYNGLATKYHFHVLGLQETVKEYKAELPKGMQPSDAHIDMLLGKVSSTTGKVRYVKNEDCLFLFLFFSGTWL